MRTRTLVASSLFFLASCDSENACDLKAELAARAGANAKDCGRVAINGNPMSVDACVVQAFGDHQAFFAQYDQRGIDSRLIRGLAGDGAGHVTFLLWDGDPSGGSGHPPVISGFTCEAPSVDTSATRDPATMAPLVCGSTTSLGQTCG